MPHHSVPALEQLTWTEASDLLKLSPVGLLPVGAIEAHGPHLPLNSDVIIASGMARYGGSRLYASGIPSVILPPVSYSVSYAGACFPGTTPIPAETFTSYLTDLLVNHASQGYRVICACNAHLEPAHIAAVQAAIDRASETAAASILFPDQRLEPWSRQLGEEFARGSRHAGNFETSIVMAEAPDQVRRVHLEQLEPLWIDLPAALRAGAADFAEAGADQGYFGDPGAATPEHGEQLLDTLGTMIEECVLESLARRT